MTLATWLSRLFSPKARREDGQPTQAGGYIGFYPSRFLPPDTYLTGDDALSLSAVWGCVSYISRSLAACRVRVLDKDPSGKRRAVDTDRLHRLLNLRPNPDTTAMALKEGWISQALVFGDGYVEIRRDMAGRPFELYLLPSMAVVPRRVGEDLVYDYRPATSGVDPRTIQSGNILHLRGPSLYSFLGESTVTRAARSIAIAKAADEFALSYYVNNTVVGGVVKRNGVMDANALKALREEFERVRAGAARAHKAMVLPQGVEYEPLEADAQKSQSVEARQHSVVDICRFFAVPPPLVGDLGRATWANLESLYIQVVRDCLGPWAKRVEEEVEWKAFGDGSTKWIEIDLKPLTQGGAKERAEAQQILRRNGVISANEWRESEGLDPIGEEGELRVIESNMTLLDEEALMPPEPQPAPAPSAEVDPAGASEEPEDELGANSPDASVKLTVQDAAAFHRWLQRRRKATP